MNFIVNLEQNYTKQRFHCIWDLILTVVLLSIHKLVRTPTPVLRQTPLNVINKREVDPIL